MLRNSQLLPVAALLASLALTGCTTTGREDLSDTAISSYAGDPVNSLGGGPLGAVQMAAYAPVTDGGFNLPQIPTERIDPQFLRQRVSYDAQGFPAGSVVVDTGHHFLYVIEAGGTAMRYGIGIGKAGFEWAGEAYVRDKQHWPRWFPPA